MIKKLSACSPTPFRNLPSRLSLLSFGLTLFCLVPSVYTSSAQTRPKRSTVKSEERQRRIDDEAQAGASESGPSDNVKQAAQPSLVRKTSMTYSPRTGNESVERPTLTNDIVIISRAPEASPARRLNTSKAGATPSNVPSIWPVFGPLRSGVGMRSNPFGGSSIEYHKGQDIAAPTGTPVNATADGVIVIAGWVKGYGNGIYIDHGNGISTRYGHLSRIDVVVGQIIKQGQHLGLVGSTGRSTGPHLHYEVRINGQPTNPLNYLPPPPPAPLAHAAQGRSQN
jgi:murein DD-endopeptidase MepM/ murein hydrolase activator NlpD